MATIRRQLNDRWLCLSCLTQIEDEALHVVSRNSGHLPGPEIPPIERLWLLRNPEDHYLHCTTADWSQALNEALDEAGGPEAICTAAAEKLWATGEQEVVEVGQPSFFRRRQRLTFVRGGSYVTWGPSGNGEYGDQDASESSYECGVNESGRWWCVDRRNGDSLTLSPDRNLALAIAVPVLNGDFSGRLSRSYRGGEYEDRWGMPRAAEPHDGAVAAGLAAMTARS